MTAHEPNNETANKSPGATAEAVPASIEGVDDDGNAEFVAHLELGAADSCPADYELWTSQASDEYVDVALKIEMGRAEVELTFTQEQAKAFADELTTAAQRGNDGLGE